MLYFTTTEAWLEADRTGLRDWGIDSNCYDSLAGRASLDCGESILGDSQASSAQPLGAGFSFGS
jgi:hypothetical protein